LGFSPKHFIRIGTAIVGLKPDPQDGAAARRAEARPTAVDCGSAFRPTHFNCIGNDPVGLKPDPQDGGGPSG